MIHIYIYWGSCSSDRWEPEGWTTIWMECGLVAGEALVHLLRTANVPLSKAPNPLHCSQMSLRGHIYISCICLCVFVCDVYSNNRFSFPSSGSTKYVIIIGYSSYIWAGQGFLHDRWITCESTQDPGGAFLSTTGWHCSSSATITLPLLSVVLSPASPHLKLLED